MYASLYRSVFLCFVYQFDRVHFKKKQQQLLRDEIALLDVHSRDMTNFPYIQSARLQQHNDQGKLPPGRFA